MLFSDQRVTHDPRATVVTKVEDLVYWEKLLNDCASKGWISADTETDAFDPFRGGRIIGHCFGYDPGDGYGERGVYFPIRHRTGDAQLPVEPVTQIARGLLGNPTHRVVLANTSFDAMFYRADGIELDCQIDDTMIGSHLLDENESHELEDLCVRYGIDERAHEHKKVVKQIQTEEAKWRRIKKSAMPGYAYIPVPVLGPYGCKDGYNTLRLAKTILPHVYNRYGPLYATEMTVLRALIDAQWIGTPVDVPYLQQLQRRNEDRLEQATKTIRQLLRSPHFNPSSDDQVREILYDKHRGYGLPVYQLTQSKLPGVGAFALKEIRRYHPEYTPLINALLEYRDADKIITTYCDGIIRRTDERGYLHCKFKQVGTVTGRMSATDPNLQNMSADAGKNDPNSIRHAFLVPPRKIRLHIDYSQVELRVLAFCAQEPTMIQAFINNEDIHLRNQIEVFNDPDKKSTRRRVVKVLAFGTAYGMTPKGIMENLNDACDPMKGDQYIDEKQAEEWYGKFHGRYSRITAYTRELVQMMRRRTPPSFDNIFGRTRRIPDLNDHRQWVVESGIRRMIASMIQGTAADIAKLALARLYRRWKEAARLGLYQASLANIVHDENQIDVDREGAPLAALEAKQIMEAFPELSPVPIIADAEWTETRWTEKTEIPFPKAA